MSTELIYSDEFKKRLSDYLAGLDSDDIELQLFDFWCDWFEAHTKRNGDKDLLNFINTGEI